MEKLNCGASAGEARSFNRDQGTYTHPLGWFVVLNRGMAWRLALRTALSGHIGRMCAEGARIQDCQRRTRRTRMRHPGGRMRWDTEFRLSPSVQKKAGKANAPVLSATRRAAPRSGVGACRRRAGACFHLPTAWAFVSALAAVS